MKTSPMEVERYEKVNGKRALKDTWSGEFFELEASDFVDAAGLAKRFTARYGFKPRPKKGIVTEVDAFLHVLNTDGMKLRENRRVDAEHTPQASKKVNRWRAELYLTLVEQDASIKADCQAAMVQGPEAKAAWLDDYFDAMKDEIAAHQADLSTK